MLDSRKKDDTVITKKMIKPKVSAKAVQLNKNLVSVNETKIHSFIPDIEFTETDDNAPWTAVLIENIDKGMTPEVQTLSDLKIKQINSFIESIKKSGLLTENLSDAPIESLEVEILE